ncbi:non-hydrolyzing UDP-N-acetylglucosamine 2-epimerase [Brevibacterium luteolum]|uniref:non-hydrolyzing UDP-N-acetylglucosamine 2-epimerase n=1 Tax=Brevibacterium luteolum TaxID=199591 RepID=UPI0038794139
MVVYGTRPEAIKVAPVIRALEASETLRPVSVVTAQHREMLDQVNAVFGIEPDVDLNLMRSGQTLNEIAARVIDKLDGVYADYQPAAVVVQGDTTTVMSAAIAAFNREIPVVHLEAGLRSGNIMSPFPEEANRKLVSQITRLHLAPTERSKQNLIAEGIDEESTVLTGNTVIDALQWAVKQPVEFSDPAVTELHESSRRVILLTAHRRENLGDGVTHIGKAVGSIARKYPDISIVWPAHRNPAVREAIEPHIRGLENVLMIEPVGYGEFSHLIARAHIVLTDSGGLQEEAPTLGKPVLVMRENTERPEAVEAGTAKLIGTNPDRIESEVERLLNDPEAYREMAEAINPFGDGTAAEQSVGAIVRMLSALEADRS